MLLSACIPKVEPKRGWKLDFSNGNVQSVNVNVGLFAGVIFEQNSDEIQAAFKMAMSNYIENGTSRKFELEADLDVINTADAFKLSKISEFQVILSIYRTEGMPVDGWSDGAAPSQSNGAPPPSR